MTLLFVEFVSTFMLILSLLLMLAILLKHFKGMQAPAHWVYFLGAFSLLAMSSTYSRIFPGDAQLDTLIRLVANVSIFMGSYELFKRYESKPLIVPPPAKKRRRRK